MPHCEDMHTIRNTQKEMEDCRAWPILYVSPVVIKGHEAFFAYKPVKLCEGAQGQGQIHNQYLLKILI